MLNLDEFSLLIGDLGDAIPEVIEIVQHGQGPSWALSFEGDVVVIADLDVDSGVLEFSADLGRPAEQNRAAVCEAVLAYNALRRDTGGITMALSEPGGDFEQHYDITAAELNPGLLKAIVVNFAAKATMWRQTIAAGASDQASDGQSDSDALMAAAIRV